jgi:hypothetical protein
MQYYEGVREAMLEHVRTTEEGIRKLEGVEPAKIEKLVADVHKRHEKLLKRVDRQIDHAKSD